MFELKFDDHLPFPADYPRVRLSKDIEVSSPVGARVKGTLDREGLPFDLRAVIEVIEGRFAITELILNRIPSGPAIGAAQIAMIRVWDFIAGSVYASNSMVYTTSVYSGRAFVAQATASEAWQFELDKLSELDSPRDDLAGLARFYRMTRLGHYNPTEVVASALAVNGSTIRRWLAEAVAAGELTQEERAK